MNSLSEKKDLVPVTEKGVTPTVEIPVQALQTFRDKYPLMSGIPKRMEIKHDFIEIDQGIRYAIMVLVEAGYTKNYHFPASRWAASNWNMEGLIEDNPVLTGVRDGFYDYKYAGEDWHYPDMPPTTVLPWHEILISPFTDHHERSLLLTFGQLGFTVGELGLWLDIQVKRINETVAYLGKENERIMDEWIAANYPKKRNSGKAWEAWIKYCYANSPHNYPKYVQLRKTKNGLYTLSGASPTDWYNWRNYLHYHFWTVKPYPASYQRRSVYDQILEQPASQWYFKLGAETYVPYLFVNPEVDLVLAKYVLSYEAQRVLGASTKLFPRLPEDVLGASRERPRLVHVDAKEVETS